MKSKNLDISLGHQNDNVNADFVSISSYIKLLKTLTNLNNLHRRVDNNEHKERQSSFTHHNIIIIIIIHLDTIPPQTNSSNGELRQGKSSQKQSVLVSLVQQQQKVVFAHQLQPCIDHQENTIISDQDKGSLAAVAKSPKQFISTWGLRAQHQYQLAPLWQ